MSVFGTSYINVEGYLPCLWVSHCAMMCRSYKSIIQLCLYTDKICIICYTQDIYNIDKETKKMTLSTEINDGMAFSLIPLSHMAFSVIEFRMVQRALSSCQSVRSPKCDPSFCGWIKVASEPLREPGL